MQALSSKPSSKKNRLGWLVWVLGFRLGFRVRDLGLRVQDLGFRMHRASGLGFRNVQDVRV